MDDRIGDITFLHGVCAVIRRSMALLTAIAAADPTCPLATLSLDAEVLQLCASMLPLPPESSQETHFDRLGRVVSVLLSALSQSNAAQSGIWTQVQTDMSESGGSASARAWRAVVPLLEECAFSRGWGEGPVQTSLALHAGWCLGLVANKVSVGASMRTLPAPW